MPLDPNQVEWDQPAPRLRYDAPENLQAFRTAAADLGIDPVDLATVISYETGGTFDPDQPGPTTKWGQHRGLIQFGEPQAQKYGVRRGMSIAEQLPAVVSYLRDSGVKPGMGIMDVYSAINAGAPGRYTASDAAAGGAPGTVADKVNYQMGDHRRRAQSMFGGLPVEQVAWDAPPAIDASAVQWDAPAAAPVAAAPEEPGYLEGVAGALGNLLTGEQPILERVAMARNAIEPDIVQGVRARTAELGSKLVRGIANVGEPVGDFLESNIPLSGLTPEQIQNERQLQPLYDLSDALGGYADDNRYQPGVTFQDVKDDPLSLNTPQFIAEQAVLSAPDMAASVFALPAYMLGRTEEIAERRVQNDAPQTVEGLITGEQPAAQGEPGLGDLFAAAPGAVVESLLERYATGRLPGAAPGGSAVGNVLRETAVQAGTEALEEGAANIAESAGTRRGVDAGELIDTMGAGALVGGGLGAGVRTATEVGSAVRGSNIDPAAVQWDEPAAAQQETAQPELQQASEPVEPSTVTTPTEAATPAATVAPTEQAAPAAEPAAPVEATTAPELPAPVEVATPQVAEAEAAPQARRAEEVEAARMQELRTKRRAEPLTPQESDELVTLMERDAHAAKVAGRRIQGVQNMAAREELEQAGALKPVQAFADADDFKSFNDQMGHDVGDSVIRTLGQEFSAVLGDGNVFHRGGDEFVLQADSPEQMASAMDAVRSKLAEAEFVMTMADGTTISRKGVGFSYGVGANIQEAENAQYQDKSARKAAGLRTGTRDAVSAPANTDGADPRSGAVDRQEGDEGGAADAGRSPQAIAAERAPLLESTNDRFAVPDEQEEADGDGADAAPREAVELEDRSESAERNTRRKGASDEFTRASFTNRRSWQQAAFRDAGLDPDAAELLPVDKQFEAAAKALKSKFGLTAQKTPKALGRMAVDNALDLYRNAQTMAHVLGLPEKAVGLGDSLTLLFRGDAPYLGAMYPGGGTVEGVKIPAGAIALPGRSNSFAHEWGHALDLHLVAKYGMDPLEGLTTRQIRLDGIDFEPSTSREAFAKLMNAMFFDEAALAARVAALQQAANSGTDLQQAAAKQALERIAKGNSKLKIDGTKYLIESRAFGASVGGKAGAKYFGDPAEMLARAFEAYVAHRVEAVGGSTEVLAKGDNAYLSNTDDRFAKTFPKLDERLAIFAAFDDLFGQLAKENLVAEGVPAANPGNMDAFDPRLWLGEVGKRPEYRGIKGAFREQADDWNAARDRSRRAAARPADPMSRKERIQNALMVWTTPIQGVFRVMEKRYANSKAMRELADKLVTAPGHDRVVGRTYEQAVRITSGRAYNQFGNIVDRYDLNRLSDADRETLRRLLVSAAEPTGKLVKPAAELRRFMDSLWYDNQEAGINIGYTKNGYLPRMLDMAMVQADPEAFVKAAAEAYAIKLENDEMVQPEEVAEESEKMARAWLHNLMSAPAMDFASKSPAENYTKHRSLPAEADVLLEKFYVNDPLEVIHRYIGMSARNTEFAKMFGPKGEQLNDLFGRMTGEGVSLEDQRYMQGAVNSLMGRQNPGVLDGKPRAQALMNQINAYGVMSMLGRVLISSLAEPGMAGIRTGSAAAVYKPYFNLIKQVVGTADMKQWREITRSIGLIGDAQADMVVQARLGGTYESTPKTDARLARYFALTGLHGLTNAQRVALMPVTHQYLGSLVEQAQEGSAAQKKEAKALLAELGIKNPGQFAIGDNAPTMTDLFDRDGRETEFGAQYMTAMSRINEQIVQAPNRYDRPEMANSPTGRFLYGIMSFNLAFWNNVYKREANVLKRQAKERGALGVASYVGGHLVPPLTAYFFTQLLVTAAREALLNPQRWEEWDRDEKLVENLVMLTISRAFPAGLFDIPIQAYQGLKYQRDITSIAIGAVPSYFLMSLQKVAAAFRSENSDKTNNAEFGAMQGAYQLLANPLIAHILTSAPGGRILDPLYGVGIAVGTSAAARDTAAQAVVGERDSLVAKRKRDERKAAGTGVESAGDRGSSRGSVRNNDQRGSTR